MSLFFFFPGKTYFFKGKSYYEFDDLRFKVAGPAYLSAPFWMGCPWPAGGNPKLAAVPHSLGDDVDADRSRSGGDWATHRASPGHARGSHSYASSAARLVPLLRTHAVPHVASLLVVLFSFFFLSF